MRLGALVLLGGCTKLFGLSQVDLPPADAAADVAMRTVSCDYLWHVVPAAGEVQAMAAPPGYAHILYEGQELAIGGDGSFSRTQADFRTWSYPFAESTVVTFSFRVAN